MKLRKQSDLAVRAQTALVFVSVMLLGFYLHTYTYVVLMLTIMIGSLHEYFNLLKLTRATNRVTGYYKPLAYLVSALLFISTWGFAAGELNPAVFLLFPALILSFFILELFADSNEPFTNIAKNVMGIAYVALPLSMLNLFVFVRGDYYEMIAISVLLLTWANDAGAYMLGSQLGKNKLFPRISPGKSWEGAVGGVLCCIAAAITMHFVFGITAFSFFDWVMIGTTVSIASIFGDLVQSMMKRALKIKDTGTFLPGHGGFLDRFDAFYFSIPFLAFYFGLKSLLEIL